MKSMTGYGKAEYSENDIDVKVEIKTVNNRYLDINCKMPRILFSLEDMLRKVVSAQVNRGRADIYVTFCDNREKDKIVNIDYNLAKGYLDAAQILNKKFGVVNDMTVSQLLKTPDVVKNDAEDNDTELFAKVLSQSAMLAVKNLNEMREAEGNALKTDILKKLEILKEYTLKIREKSPLVAEDYKTKLTARITEALDKVEYDETRLLNEVAFYTDKSSIDEELSRLNSHYNQLGKILNDKESSGRKLDFLIQELNREVNTICSKSNDTDITNYGLILKSEIEKIREQVQNLE